MSAFDKGLIINQNVTQLVAQYDSACETIKQSYQALDDAEKRLKQAFGESYFSTLPNRSSSSPVNEILGNLKTTAWKSIIAKIGIRKVMSSARWDELYKKLDDPKQLPELTIPAISDIVNTFVQSANDFFQEAVKESFEWIRPHKNDDAAKYRTNQKNAKFEVGRKIIITGIITNKYFGGYQVNHWQSQKLLALDKVFFQLDGKREDEDISYNSPLIDAINRSETGYAETDYFTVKMYQNGNLHLEFKRLDLLQKFNAIAGGANLRG